MRLKLRVRDGCEPMATTGATKAWFMQAGAHVRNRRGGGVGAINSEHSSPCTLQLHTQTTQKSELENTTAAAGLSVNVQQKETKTKATHEIFTLSLTVVIGVQVLTRFAEIVQLFTTVIIGKHQIQATNFYTLYIQNVQGRISMESIYP